MQRTYIVERKKLVVERIAISAASSKQAKLAVAAGTFTLNQIEAVDVQKVFDPGRTYWRKEKPTQGSLFEDPRRMPEGPDDIEQLQSLLYQFTGVGFTKERIESWTRKQRKAVIAWLDYCVRLETKQNGLVVEKPGFLLV